MNDQTAAMLKIADGIRIAAGRLRRGYGEIHPGIENFASSFEHSSREIESSVRDIRKVRGCEPPQAEKHDPDNCWWCRNPQSETELEHAQKHGRFIAH